MSNQIGCAPGPRRPRPWLGLFELTGRFDLDPIAGLQTWIVGPITAPLQFSR